MIKNYAFGADPEVFLFDVAKNQYISAVGKIGGSKLEPMPVTNVGHALQEDNVAVEFNFPPTKSPEKFAEEVMFMQEMIRERIKHKYIIRAEPAAYFHESELATPEAQNFGCEPDFNAWELCENTVTRYEDERRFLRTCGGHLHVSWDNPDMHDQIDLIRALDIFAGIRFAGIEGHNSRRQLYGNPGAFRFKSYGAEYRTLSNIWITKEVYCTGLIDLAEQAIEFVNSGKKVDEDDYPNIRKAIVEGNWWEGDKLIKKYGVKIPAGVAR